MASSRQGDLFGQDEQDDVWKIIEPRLPRGSGSDARKLHRILLEARAARNMPWEPARVPQYRTMFPQMTNRLPEDEGAQLRFAFESDWRGSRRHSPFLPLVG